MLNRHHRLALLACTAFVTLAGATLTHAQSTEGSEGAAEKQGRVTVLKKLSVKGAGRRAWQIRRSPRTSPKSKSMITR